MDSSRRAVEAYWRSRMIEAATSDEDKVTPVYKLEEICELLRSSHLSIVKEVSEYVLKRLEHKSPVVKQKALRLIKYSVGKSGVEFRREIQRHSAAVRQLFHYKGHPDPLKGDALNKAVRDMAHEALSAMFATEDNKPSPAEDLNRRIEGFGNTNFEMSSSSDDKKSFLSEVVGIGSASIMQGLSNITGAHALRKNENGSYKGPVLRRSLTTEIDSPDRYDRVKHNGEMRNSSGLSKNNVGGVIWGQNSATELPNEASSASYAGSKSREERLLETIVSSGGVRLQPSRDAIHVFLMEASKLDAVAMSRALESKLQSHLWQVRMKAVCVLDSILRKKDDAHFAIVASYFSENRDVIVKCSESPQSSLREKACKVLSLLGGEQASGAKNLSDKSPSVKAETSAVVDMPDLIDTGESDEYHGRDAAANMEGDSSVQNLMSSGTPVIDDLFGDSSVTGTGSNEHKIEEDPFADVSFHTTEDKVHVNDLFSGLTIDDKQSPNGDHMPATKNVQEVFDIFGSGFEPLQERASHKNDMNDLVAGLSNSKKVPDTNPQNMFTGALPEVNTDLNTQPNHQVPNNAFNGIYDSQIAGMNQNTMFPLGPLPYNVPPNLMFNQAFASQPINYGSMGNYLAQQQLFATMSNFQPIGGLNVQANTGLGQEAGNALPNIFNPNMPVQSHITTTNNPKKEETKAFDFISILDSASAQKPIIKMHVQRMVQYYDDHLSAVRDPKRVI